jgi:uncharacterized membrane protein YfcA
MIENMYTGKSSRNPYRPLLSGLLIGLLLIAFGVYMYIDLAAWEESNQQKRLNRMIWWLYDVGGKISVAAFFCGIGSMMLLFGIKSTLHQLKLKREVKKEEEIV